MHVEVAEQDALADRRTQAAGAAIDLAARRLLRGVLLGEHRVRQAPALDLTNRLIAPAADQQRKAERKDDAVPHGAQDTPKDPAKETPRRSQRPGRISGSGCR